MSLALWHRQVLFYNLLNFVLPYKYKRTINQWEIFMDYFSMDCVKSLISS